MQAHDDSTHRHEAPAPGWPQRDATLTHPCERGALMNSTVDHPFTIVRRIAPRLIAGLLVLILVGAAGPVGAGPREEPDEALLEKPVASIPGPKRAVAVSRFIAKSDFDARYGLSDVGGGLAALLTSALVESGQFIVVERATLSDVLSEQQLNTSGLINPESGPPLSQLVGADLLIMGSITEFAEEASGMGFGIGIAGFGISPQSRKGKVGLDIRVIHTTTGQVIAAYHVAESVKSKALSVDMNKKGISLGHTSFGKTPLGQAVRKAIEKVVHKLAKEAAKQPWNGRVVDFDFGEVVINAGATSGIRLDDTFGIQRVLRTLTDPVTGQVLGHRSADIGHMVVTRVEDGLAFGRFTTEWEVVPERGDVVVIR